MQQLLRRILHVAAVVIISIICSCAANSQAVYITETDSSAFPVITTKFICFDSAGQFFFPPEGEVSLKINGQPVPIASTRCPQTKPPVRISSLLTLDISVSMATAGEAGRTNLDMVKAAAKAWIDALPTGQSEGAITCFNEKSLLLQDYTLKKEALYNTVKLLSPSGGTDYSQALLTPVAGALQISRSAGYKKVVVFLSDGMPNSPPDTAEILAEALRQNCTIFAVIIGIPCPSYIKYIVEKTEGRWYEQITTVHQAEAAYRTVLREALEIEPCEVAWKCPTVCGTAANLDISIESLGISEKFPISLPSKALSSLDISPRILNFGRTAPGTLKTMPVTLSARTSDYRVDSIALRRGPSIIRCTTKEFPLLIPAGSSKTITVEFTPLDSNRVYSTFEVFASPCPAFFSATGGKGRKVPDSNATISVVFPNGGEHFVVGSDTTLRWSGVLSDESVNLYYSSNMGLTWQTIVKNVTGNSYRWHVPRITGRQLLFRVSQSLEEKPALKKQLPGHSWWVNSAEYSPDASMIVTASVDNTAKVWNAENGAALRTITGHTNWVRHAAFSPDGAKILTVSDDNTAKIWNANNGLLIKTFSDAEWGINSAVFSPDGKHIVTTSADSKARIIDVSTSDTVRVLRGHTHEITKAAYTADGSKIITGSWDNSLIIWNAATATPIRVLRGHEKPVRDLVVSPGGSFVISASDDNTLKVWNISNGKLLRTFGSHGTSIASVALSPDGASAVTTGAEDSTLKVWDVESGRLIMALAAGKGVLSYATYSPDGASIIATGRDKTVKIWDAEPAVLQDDVSDAPWFVVATQITGVNIDLRLIPMGGSRDTVVEGFLRNSGGYNVRVDSIWLENNPRNQLAHVSGFPPFVVPKNGKSWIELHCSPVAPGEHSAVIGILTQTGDTLRQKVTWRGFVPSAVTLRKDIVFPKTDVGTPRDTIVSAIIKNTGKTPLTGTFRIGAPGDDVFSLFNQEPDITILPGATAQVGVRFLPLDGGRVQGALLFDYAGGETVEITLFGEGVRRLPNITVKTINKNTGNPIANAEIAVRETKKSSVKKFFTDERGTFVLPVAAGTEVEISARTGELLPDSRKIVVAGDTTVVLSLSETMALRINFNDNEAETPYQYLLDSNGVETNQTWQESMTLLAEYLLQHQNKIRTFLVVGHSDDRASQEYNLRLGLERSRFVVEELGKLGVPKDLLRASSRGKAELLPQKEGEDIEAYRKRCRRIETRTVFR